MTFTSHLSFGATRSSLKYPSVCPQRWKVLRPERYPFTERACNPPSSNFMTASFSVALVAQSCPRCGENAFQMHPYHSTVRGLTFLTYFCSLTKRSHNSC